MDCEECGVKLPPSTGSGRPRTYCKICIPDGYTGVERTEIRRKFRLNRANKQKLKRGCDHCGYANCPQALEWHHDNDDKTKAPATAITISWTQYEAEIAKCVLLCANCHREAHFGSVA